MELIIIILLLIFIIMIFTLKPPTQSQYQRKPQVQKVNCKKRMDNLVMLPKLNPVPLTTHITV